MPGDCDDLQQASFAAGTGWAILALLWITYCLNYVDRQAAFSIYPALRSHLKFSDTQLGRVGSIFTCRGPVRRS